MKLINVSGNIYCENKSVDLKFTDVYDIVEVEVDLLAPDKPGLYLSEWVLSYENFMFGPRIWCAIEVVQNQNDNKLITIDVEQQQNNHLQLQSPLLPLTSETNRKFSTSTEINESFPESISISEDDENEFVIIPDCFDLSKKWAPQIKTADTVSDFDCDIIKKSPPDIEYDQANSTSTLMLINELLLIPKYKKDENEKAQNLMTFSTSINESKVDESIENTEYQISDNLNATLTEEKDLLTFSDDYSNLKNKNNQCETPTSTNDSVISAISSNTQQQSTYSPQQYPSLDNFARLASMGFANRSLNNKLLNKHTNDINKVINELLLRNDNDWASYRH